MQLSNQSSAMSSLTTANTSFAPVDDRKRKRANAASSDDNEPSPITALPDFSNRNSDNDLVASGDNSEGWDEKEGRVGHDLCAQAIVDELWDNAVFPDVQANEVKVRLLINELNKQSKDIWIPGKSLCDHTFQGHKLVSSDV